MDLLTKSFVAEVAAHDFEFFLFAGIANFDLEHEAVYLGFGKRIGAFLLDGVLGSQYQKGFFKFEGIHADGHLALLHGFQQGTLYLGGCAVDLVGQDEIGEDGPFAHRKLVLRRVVNHGADDVGRQKIGCKLDAAKAGIDGLRKGFDGQGFGQTG